MSEITVGLLHPGEMGAAVGQCLAAAGHRVLWVPGGRSPASAARAAAAGLTAADGGLAGLAAQADVIVSVCPPHAALEVAPAGGAGFGGVYADANAISPATAREVARIVEGGGAQLRGRRDHRDSPGDAGIHQAVPVRARAPGRSSGCSRAARRTCACSARIRPRRRR